MDLLTKGIEQIKDEDYEGAAVSFQQAIEKEPLNPDGYINFANLLLHIDDTPRAEKLYQRAIEIDSESVAAQYGLGLLYFEQEAYQKASKQFKEAIELGLEEADAYFMLASSLGMQSKTSDALPFLEKAYQLDQEQLEYALDRKSTRLNSSHVAISYAVFCLKKKRKSNCKYTGLI